MLFMAIFNKRARAKILKRVRFFFFRALIKNMTHLGVPIVQDVSTANIIFSLSRGFSLLLTLIHVFIAVIAVAPTDRASFVYSYLQTRLRGQYNGK